jgi:thiosulfate dehydrogenase [quinone] large subunit
MANAGSQWTVLENPRWVTALFSSTEFAWVWLIARVYIGWGWLHSGWEKVNSESWMAGGTSLQGYWERAVAIPETGRPAISYDWYRGFLQLLLDTESYTWFAKLVAVGELLVGIALLLGIFTGIAAFFGAFMNWNFMLAGSASTNPVMGIVGIGLIIAWKTAGWWGLDRFVLPYLGAPWQRGPLLGGQRLGLAGRNPASPAQLAEQWFRILLGVALALGALISLSGPLQVIILLVSGVIVAIGGLGILPLVPEKREPAARGGREGNKASSA